MNILEGLNDQQLEAVQHTEGYLRVIAGAGSGKTKLLVSRYAYLVQYCGINPASILCVTFTNKAAGEMKRRIRSLIGEEYDTSLICTYHGFCVRILREDCGKLFYPKEFQIIDTAQQKAILSEIYQELELKLDHATFEKILEMIGKVKADEAYVRQMCSREQVQIMPEILTLDDEIIERYLQKQKKIYALDFHDLLSFALHLLNTSPEVRRKWQDRLNYIQVDEFQDSSRREMKLIEILSGQYRNLMIVGDPDQNIYEWRGSDVRLLVDFDKNHPDTRTVFLNRNYRSTPQILQCANTLIARNQYRLKKDLYTESPCGQDVLHIHAKSEDAEAESIIDSIMRLRREEGYRCSDFAILYRASFLSRNIEKKLTEHGIPYEIYGGVRFFQRMEIQDIVAYLRLIAFDDSSAFRRIVNTPRRRMGRKKLQRIQELQHGGSEFQTLLEHIDDPVFRSSGAREFTDMILRMRENLRTHNLAQMVNEVCAASGYENYIRELGDMERFDNLSEFKRLANEYEQSFGENVSLQEFLGHIALQISDETDEDADTVKLMTIHAAKGLEFPCVFVTGFTEGIFPSSKTIEERREMGLEEERRLCYVALTRAEHQLFLTDSEGFSTAGIQKLPSRFLTEIGEDNYVRIGRISKDLMEKSRQFIRRQGPLSVQDAKAPANVVEHPVFGRGVITEVLGGGMTYKIKFDSLPNERYLSADFFAKDRNAEIGTAKTKQENRPETVESHTVQEPQSPTEIRKAWKQSILDKPAEISPVKEPAPKQPEPEEPTFVADDTFVIPEQINVHSNESAPPAEPEEDEGYGTITPEKSANLWKRSDVPHTGWSCTGITDLGEPSGICQMCGYQIIRYVHHMEHPQYAPLDAGCICAGKMEGNIENAKRRESEFKNRQSRKASFMKRKWKCSRNNNPYLKIRNHIIVLYKQQRGDVWKYSIDNKFCPEIFATKEEAIAAVFEALEA